MNESWSTPIQAIHVVRTKSDGARLYVHGELIDTTNDLFESEDEATVVGVVGESETLVEDFREAVVADIGACER